MSREIKFRAWDGLCFHYQEEQYLTSFLDRFIRSVNYDNGIYSDHASYLEKDIHCYLQQYIGINDKNNVMIYEGDIVKVTDIDTGEDSLHAVKYYAYDDYPAFDLSPALFEESNSFSGIACSMQYEIEVVGNVYENHDLLVE